MSETTEDMEHGAAMMDNYLYPPDKKRKSKMDTKPVNTELNLQGASLPPSTPPVRASAPVRSAPPPVKAMPVAPTGPVVAKPMVQFGKLTKSTAGHRILLYGPGGIGKTTLACSMPGPVAFVDIEESLGKIQPQLEEYKLAENIVPINGVSTWAGLRATLQSGGWDGVKTIVIDTATKAEELAIAWMFANVREKGVSVSRMEDYGYKSGYRHLFDTFNLLLGDLDVHSRAGRHVVLVCHDCAAKVPNPQGLDWIRYEPRLSQDDKNCQLKLRCKEWADHVLAFIYDINVGKDGKGQGTGTRTIYASEYPHCMAKSRTTQGSFGVDRNENFWSKVIY